MTRKHFNELAAQLRITREESAKTSEQLAMWRRAVAGASPRPMFDNQTCVEHCA